MAFTEERTFIVSYLKAFNTPRPLLEQRERVSLKGLAEDIPRFAVPFSRRNIEELWCILELN